jgi:hypothetical protein
MIDRGRARRRIGRDPRRLMAATSDDQ